MLCSDRNAGQIVSKMENQVNENLSETEKKEIGARFLQAFKEALNLEDKAKIAKILGYEDKKGGVIYKIADGKQELNFSKLERFSRVTGISIHWLITGELPKIAKRIDFKNIWKRLVEAWERTANEDRSSMGDFETIKEMSMREGFMPTFQIVERASSITQTPMLWLLTGEGPSQGKPFENAPVYLADLIIEYKAKDELPLPLKRQIMVSAQKGDEKRPFQFEQKEETASNNIPFSTAEEAALKRLANEKGQNVEEKIREFVVSQLLVLGAITLQDVNTKAVTSAESAVIPVLDNKRAPEKLKRAVEGDKDEKRQRVEQVDDKSARTS